MNTVRALHIFLIGPLLIAIGALKPQASIVYLLMQIMGALLMLSFAWKLYKYGFRAHSLWYIVHMVVFAAMILYIGFTGRNAPPVAFSLLMALGITAISYHFVRHLGY